MVLKSDKLLCLFRFCRGTSLAIQSLNWYEGIAAIAIEFEFGFHASKNSALVT